MHHNNLYYSHYSFQNSYLTFFPIMIAGITSQTLPFLSFCRTANCYHFSILLFGFLALWRLHCTFTNPTLPLRKQASFLVRPSLQSMVYCWLLPDAPHLLSRTFDTCRSRCLWIHSLLPSVVLTSLDLRYWYYWLCFRYFLGT